MASTSSPSSEAIMSESPLLRAVAHPLQSTKPRRLSNTASSSLLHLSVEFASTEIDSRADHFVRPRKSSLKASRPSTSEKLESSLYDVQLDGGTDSAAAYVDQHAVDTTHSHKSSNCDQRGTSLRLSSKLESPVEDVNRLQSVTFRLTRGAALLLGPMVFYMVYSQFTGKNI